MSQRPVAEHAPQSAPARDFYLGRQPILDRNQALLGYELLFRNAPSGPADFENGMSATASVIAHAAQLGLEKVIGDALGFLNADASVIHSDIFVFLPREKVVLEISAAMQATPALLERIAELKSHGFRFALDDIAAGAENVGKLLPLVEFVKLDTRALGPAALAKFGAPFRACGKKLLAGKVETREEYQACLDLGFDYFQGYYFARPVVISGRKLSPAQLAVTELMALVTSDVDNIVIERAVKKDVTLALNLLRLVNTPGVGARHKIDSLSQAVLVLGRRQLQRWLQIMLYAEPARGQSMTPLLMLATTRGRMLELLAQRLRPSQRNVADVAFTVGIMSLMDTLFGMPMDELLQQIPVIDEVSDALLRRTGFFGELLNLSEALERLEEAEDQVMPALQQLEMSTDELVEMEMAAFAWSETVVRYAI